MADVHTLSKEDVAYLLRQLRSVLTNDKLRLADEEKVELRVLTEQSDVEGDELLR
eukprot:gene18942-1783_t